VKAILLKDPIFWFTLALVFVFGASFNFLPVTFPVFEQVFGATLEQLGRIQVLFYVSWLLLSMGGGWLIGQVGLKRAAIATLACLMLALVMIGSAERFSVVLLGAFWLGLSMAANVVICSSIITGHFGEKRQSVFLLSGILDSTGAIVGPAALGWWIGHALRVAANWRVGYFVDAGLIAAMIIWALMMRATTLLDRAAVPPNRKVVLSTMGDILRKPPIYGIGLLGFLHGMTQSGAISFLGQLYQKKLHIDAAQAAYLISVNSAGFFVGRSLLSWITGRWKVPELTILTLGGSAAALAFVAAILSTNYLFGLAVFCLAGAFSSGNGPSINSYLGVRFASQTTIAFALFVGLNCLGAAGGAYLTGFISTRVGVERGIWVVPVCSLALGAFSLLWLLRQKAEVRTNLE
jgi:fucose permease